MMRSIWADLLYARRALMGTPTFTALAILTLGLGIGASTAVFSVLDGVVREPLPYPDADRLVEVSATLAPTQSRDVSWPDFRDWREEAADVVALAGFAEGSETFEWSDGAEAMTGALVSAEYFSVMGVEPVLGRSFTPEEDRIDGADAVVISYGLWQARFGGAEDVLSRSVPLAGNSVPIVGVMPAGFQAPFSDVQYWHPLQDDELLRRVGLPTGSRTLSFISVIGRLRDGFEITGAQERLKAIARRIDDEAGKRPDQASDPGLVPMLDALVGDTQAMLFLIMAGAALVLAVASANVAGLAFSRAMVREHELAVRVSLGAARARLVRQLMTESGLLAVLSGGLGVVIAWGFLTLLLWLAPPGLPRLDTIALGFDGVTFAALATLMSTFVFGILPSVRSSRAAISVALAAGRRSSESRNALRPQQILVTFQVATSVVLLTGAALLATSFARLMAVNTGFDAEDVTVATVAPGPERYTTPADVDRFYERLLDEVLGIPGVESATTTYSPPLAGNGFRTSVVLDGTEEDPENRTWAGTVIIRGDYFETNGVPLLRGRTFDRSDRLGEPPVVIVNQAMADRLWPTVDPVGQRFRFSGGLSGSADSFDRAFFPDEAYTVVGVAGNVRRASLAEAPELEYYRPHAQIAWGFQYLMIRTSRELPDLGATLRSVVWSIDSTVPVRTVRSLDSYVKESVAVERFRMLLLTAFAGLTCALAMVGLYAMMTLAVARRTRETGIRVALGASRSMVVREAVGRGFRVVAVGAVIGLGTAWAGSRALATMLFDVRPTDPVTYATVVALTATIGLIACYGPARRAARIDPVQSLGHE